MTNATKEYLNNIENWKPSKSVLHFVKRMGLEFWFPSDGSNGVKFKVQQHYRLLKAVVEYYEVETNTFLFPNGTRLVYSLDDIFRLTGLPITGKPVVHSEADARDLFRRNFDIEGPLDNIFLKCDSHSSNKIKTSWLRETYESVGNDYMADQEVTLEVIKHVKAYMLYYITAFIIPDSNGNCAPAIHLNFLEDINGIHTFAWGAAALCNVHANLVSIQSKRGKQKEPNFTSQLYPLVLFFFEHIPSLIKVSSLPDAFPLMVQWTQRLYNKTGRNKTDYAKILGSEEGSEEGFEATWEPYKRLREDFVPVDYIGNGALALSRTTLHYMNQCFYHRIDLVPRQFGIVNLNATVLRPLLQLKIVSQRSGVSNRDYRTLVRENKGVNYPRMLMEWEARAESILREVGYEPNMENDSASSPVVDGHTAEASARSESMLREVGYEPTMENDSASIPAVYVYHRRKKPRLEPQQNISMPSPNMKAKLRSTVKAPSKYGWTSPKTRNRVSVKEAKKV